MMKEIQKAWYKIYGSDEVKRLTQVNITRWHAEILERIEVTKCPLQECPLKGKS